ncbi:hypothetical protein C4J97_3072 [Pseudomonas orientalis]|nr:hypothetical protein C4J97_3072 [Pseudomonas orientalis]
MSCSLHDRALAGLHNAQPPPLLLRAVEQSDGTPDAFA